MTCGAEIRPPEAEPIVLHHGEVILRFTVAEWGIQTAALQERLHHGAVELEESEDKACTSCIIAMKPEKTAKAPKLRPQVVQPMT